MPRFMSWIAFAAAILLSLSLAAEAVAARKGTRNYQPGDAGSLAPAATDREQPAPRAGTEAFEACLSLWDPYTHMTKDEWRESCRRVISERGPKPGT